MSEKTLKCAGHIPRKQLLTAGVCLGKFTHSKKFRLQITALDFLARLARYRVWVKPSGEQHFVYGNHVVKAHLRRLRRTPASSSSTRLIFRSASASPPSPRTGASRRGRRPSSSTTKRTSASTSARRRTWCDAG